MRRRRETRVPRQFRNERQAGNLAPSVNEGEFHEASTRRCRAHLARRFERPGGIAVRGQRGARSRRCRTGRGRVLDRQGDGLRQGGEADGYAGRSSAGTGRRIGSHCRTTTRTQAQFASMQTKAVALGRQLVAEERKLDRLFASTSITQDSLQESVTRIGALQADVRAAHLEAHLEQARILTPEQRAHYLRLRGYHASGAHHAH